MTPPWQPDDKRWGWAFLAALVLVFFALMFGGAVFGQSTGAPGGDPRPDFQSLPIMGITPIDQFVKVGDITNHAFRVHIVANSVLTSVNCTNCATSLDAQNIEQAIRDSLTTYGSIFPVYGVSVAAIDPSGFTASLAVTNLGSLKVNCDNCTSTGGTSSSFAAAMPTAGTAAGFRDSGGFMATASITNNNALLVEALIPSTTNVAVRVGDAANNALRVNVVAGSGGGPSGTIGTAFPVTVAPAGFRDGAGRVASGVVDNASNLFVIASQSASAWTVIATGTISAHQADTWTVTCTNCTGSTTSNFGSAFPAAGFANFKDGAGRMASATVDNASNLFVIASQGSSNWTVTATGTITAHQGDTWTVGLSTGSNTIGAVTGPAATASQASGNPLRVGFVYRSVLPTLTDGQMTDAFVTSDGRLLVSPGGLAATGSQANGNPTRIGGVAQTTGRALTDGQLGDFSLTTTSDLRVRADTSAATGSIAPSRVQMMGGTGQSANPSRVIACDNFASVTLSSNVTTLVISGSATQQVYICAMNFVVSSATAINLVEGVGSFCNTNVQGIFGGVSTASGWNLASNGGLTQGAGLGMIGKTANTGNNVCLQNSTSATVAGGISWTKF
jgi:hypothetical protein